MPQDTTPPVLSFLSAPSATPAAAPTAEFDFNATDASLVGFQCVLQWATKPAGLLTQLAVLQPEGLQYNVALAPGENTTCTSPITLYWLQPGEIWGTVESLSDSSFLILSSGMSCMI